MILEINIERLVIDAGERSFLPADMRPEQFEAVLAGELSRLFQSEGIPAPLIQQIQTGLDEIMFAPSPANIPAISSPSPDSFGAGVARAVYASFTSILPAGDE